MPSQEACAEESQQAPAEQESGSADSLLEIRIGPVRWEVLRSLGYFGGAAIAVSAGLIDPPLGVFIAAVPLIKVLTNSALPVVVRAVGEMLEGAAKPIGSDAEGVVRLEDPQKAQGLTITWSG
ncbi:MAG TPA: hypothetical protein VFA63_10090 [Pseudonocardiaceae bacterium]|jgi:hypothetical protein|nr:hypothetical protein [Pseudonocardiaceae bacterium]